ncbi:HK97-gp10 family putative phage morphogenesis protein [Lonepinella sp. BR2904]|uniref:HK97-gp10 family putative phage morphogenesis protein n=1 Tax=Lonepinella sp. BR2904 TaxID=3434551 RepID=UPI003F6DA553
MASFLDQINAFVKKVEKQTTTAQPRIMRKALNEGAKILKSSVKPLIPVLGKSTETRQKGTVKNNIRYKTRVSKNRRSGSTVVRVMRAKGKRMAAVSDNTKDRTDPFYWFMLDRGTKKMKGQHFMQQARQNSMATAVAKVRSVYIEEMAKGMR